MEKGSFRFKQFEVKHDRCAQKVGTDGVLIGAWCRVPEEGRVLDIGSGSGLISLMVAQRFPYVRIDAVELDMQAAEQGRVNFAQSKWANRLCQYADNILHFAQNFKHRYDAIVSNPPFFNQSLKNSDVLKAQARHTDTLSFENLFACVGKLLAADGIFSLIVPADAHQHIVSIARDQDLFLRRICRVKPTPNSETKRILYEFGKLKDICQDEILVIEKSRHCYTDDYIALTKEFYLKM